MLLAGRHHLADWAYGTAALTKAVALLLWGCVSGAERHALWLLGGASCSVGQGSQDQ